MVGALGGHEILHIAANHIIRAARSALSKKGKVGSEVALVRRDGVGGQIALDRQVIQVFASTALKLGHACPPPFDSTIVRRPPVLDTLLGVADRRAVKTHVCGRAYRW